MSDDITLFSGDGGEVVPFPGPPRELRPKSDSPFDLVVNNTGKYCRHYAIIVDKNERRVTCRACEAPLDPFDSLLHVAQEHQGLWRDWTNRRTEIKAANARLEMLKRLESNVRSRVRKFGIKLSGYNLDAVIGYVWSKNPGKEAKAPDVEAMLIDARPLQLLRAAVTALDDGFSEAAAHLAMRGADLLVAAVAAKEAPVEPATGPQRTGK